MTSLDVDGEDLMNLCFGVDGCIKTTERKTEGEKNIEKGLQFLSKGLIVGFRNPTSHTSKERQPWFSDIDCLDILSLISYLTKWTEKAEIVEEKVSEIKKKRAKKEEKE